MTSVVLLTTIDEVESLMPEWERLQAGGASGIYTSPAWCLAAWRNFPDLGTPYVAAAVANDGTLLGVLALTVNRGRLSWPGRSLGDEHDARVLSDSADREMTIALVHAVIRRWSSHPTVLTDVRPEGVLTGVVNSSPGCPAPILPLHEEDLEFGALGCIPGWSRKRRRGLRSARTRLVQQGTITVERLLDSRALAAALPTFVTKRLSAWNDRERLHELPAMDRHPRLPQFLTDVGRDLSSQRRCFLAQIKLDGEPIAQSLMFRTSAADLLYMSTYRPEMARYSPSHLLLADIACTAVAEGVRVIEMGRGDEPYKFDLGAVPRHLRDLALKA
ncbi:MAG: GNAT family N-acetyltransferase [Egibacteraceae bacterium]